MESSKTELARTRTDAKEDKGAEEEEKAHASSSEDNQVDDGEGKDELVKKGAVGRRFAVISIPAQVASPAADMG